MRKTFFILFFGVYFVLAGCVSNWQHSNLHISSQNQPKNISFDGNIPESMKEWDIIADVSAYWPQCDYQAALSSSTLSVDDKNQIWLFGADWLFGANGMRVPDALICPTGTDTLPRILRYNQETEQLEKVNIQNLDTDVRLVSARGWIHLGQGKTLLIGVFIMSGAWDSEYGSKNEYINYAILENDELRDLGWGNTGDFAVPDVAITGNTLYGAMARTSNVIDVFNLATEKKLSSNVIENCDSISSLDTTNENLFVLCSRYENVRHVGYHLQVLDRDLNWQSTLFLEQDVEYAQVIVDNRNRVWIGHRYIVQNNGKGWYLTEILPDSVMFNKGMNIVYFQFPYGPQMLFSMDGAIYLADYEKKEWRFIEHGSQSVTAPFPVAVGPDGKIYAFTGKYIIATTP